MSTTIESPADAPAAPRPPARRRAAAGSTTGIPTTRRSGRAPARRSPRRTSSSRSSPRTSASRSGCCGRSSSSTSRTPASRCRSPSSSSSSRCPNLVGSIAADPLHVRGAEVRRARVDDDQRVAAADPDVAAGVPRAERLAAGADATRRRCGSSRCAPRSAGFGGGNFSSSMANISFFYPEKPQGLRARPQRRRRQPRRRRRPAARAARDHHRRPGRGRTSCPMHDVNLAYAGLVWMPFIVLAAILAWRYMDSITRREDRPELVHEVAQAEPDVDHVAAVHRHVRLVHRLRVRAAARDQEHVPGVPRRRTRSSRRTSPAWASSAR